MSRDWKKSLDAAKSKFSEAQEEAKKYGGGRPLIDVSDGVHLFRLTACEITESKVGMPMLKVEWTCTDSEDRANVSKTATQFYMLDWKDAEEQEKRIKNLARFVVSMGYEFDLDDISGTVESLPESLMERQPVIRAEVTTKDSATKAGETNTFFNIRAVVDENEEGETYDTFAEETVKEEKPKATAKKSELAKPSSQNKLGVKEVSKQEVEEETKRRGRPPGAKNKPKDEETKVTKPVRKIEEVEEDEVEVEIGMRGEFTFKGESFEGEVVEIDEDEGKLVVKTEAGKKYRITGEKFTPYIESEDEEETEENEEEETEEEE